MASAPLAPPWSPPTPPVGFTLRVEQPRWPLTASRRWQLRLALAVPYLALAALVALRGIDSGINAQLEERGRLIAWGSRDLGEFIGELYPPIPTALAGALPGGAAALTWVGALAAGIMLHVAWERLRALEAPGWLIAVLLVTFGITPPFLYLAAQDLAGFVGLGLFAVAAAAFVRFVTQGDTEAGFVCGLMLGLAVACDPVAIIYTLCLGAAAPVAGYRFGGTLRSAQAATLVITFPAVGALAGWAFLQWRFTGSPLGWLTGMPGVLEFPDGVWGGLGESLRRVGIAVVLSPLFVVASLLRMRRHPELVLIAALPIIGLTVSLWLGLRTAGGHAVVLLGLLALLTVPREATRRTAGILAATAVIGCGLVFTRIATSTGPIQNWLEVLGP